MTPDEKKTAFEKSKQDKVNAKLIRKVEFLLNEFFKGSDAASPDVQLALMHILIGALRDSNFHKESSQIPTIFPKAKNAKRYGNAEWESHLQDKGTWISKVAKWDGYVIMMGVGGWVGKFVDKKQGATLSRMGIALQNESVNDYMANYTKLFITEVSRNTIREGIMSELDIMAREANDAGEFIKNVLDMPEYRKHKRDKDVRSFLFKFYNDIVNESTTVVSLKEHEEYSGITKQPINEAYVVLYAKKKGEKPASAAYRDKEMALKFEKDLKKDGYITMVTQKPVKGVDESRISEARADDYYNSATEAVNAAKADIEKRGFEVDENDWQDQIAMGGKYGRLRPGTGKTHKFTVGLVKNGKPQRKALQISLFGMPSGKYELTYYVN